MSRNKDALLFDACRLLLDVVPSSMKPGWSEQRDIWVAEASEIGIDPEDTSHLEESIPTEY